MGFVASSVNHVKLVALLRRRDSNVGAKWPQCVQIVILLDLTILAVEHLEAGSRSNADAPRAVQGCKNRMKLNAVGAWGCLEEMSWGIPRWVVPHVAVNTRFEYPPVSLRNEKQVHVESREEDQR